MRAHVPVASRDEIRSAIAAPVSPRQRRCRNHSLPPQQLQQSLQSGYIVSCWTSTACSRAKVWPKQPNGNVLRPDSTLGQPAAEIGDQTGLQLSRMPGLTLTTHLSIVGLEIRTQGAVLLAQLVCTENLLHRCSPSRPDCQESTAGLCRENIRQATSNQPKLQLTRNSPGPAIVAQSVRMQRLV